MKKYHMIRIYQVANSKGYLRNGEEYKEMVAFKSPEEEYKIEAEYTLIDKNQIIIVEKVFPYLVREVKTGVVFPVLNFKRKTMYEDSTEYISYPFGLAHTFVTSRENELISLPVTSSQTLEEYDQLHPDVDEFKAELLNIIATGKENMAAKIAEREYKKQQERNNAIAENTSRKQEKSRVRRLRQQFKRQRKTI